MKLKAEEEIKTKLQLEAENGKCIHVNSNTKLKRKTLKLHALSLGILLNNRIT